MLFNKNLLACVSTVFMASTLVSAAAFPAVVRDSTSHLELMDFIMNTNATLTFTGAKPGSLAARAGGNVNVVYCTSRSGDVCGGSCTVYTGPATCISSPGTRCMKADFDVSFCDHGGCSGSCNQYNSCGTKLGNGFCDTPGTQSITVPFI
ncbi:hypothetical protein PENSPDRAFT_616917 [Peniophora sp. CONT]|nr:hypothetical protein PENSPDRAFT_616917 [Peniophora sp. CONT]